MQSRDGPQSEFSAAVLREGSRLSALGRVNFWCAQPASTASKAPASTVASKAPKPEATKAAKKTAGKSAASGADGEKKKRRKVRKETYSSYIYKGKWGWVCFVVVMLNPLFWVSPQAGPP